MGFFHSIATTAASNNNDVWLLAFYFLLSLGVSFLCSLTEAGLLSLPTSYAIRLKQDGHAYGRILVEMKGAIDRPLAAILSLNTMAHTIGAAGVGAQAIKVFGDAWFGVVSVVLTLAILIFSEIIPKTWGARSCRSLAPFNAYLIKGMIYLTVVVVWPLEKMTSILFPNVKSHHPTTREDVALAAQLSSAGGALDAQELQLIQNLLVLQDVTIRQVMTPRTVISMLHKDMTAKEAIDACANTSFSRYPVYGTGPDDILGIVLRRDLSELVRSGRSQSPISNALRKIRAIPETAPVANILWRFFTNRHHMYLVVDEYGGTAGIVTLEDALETIFGEEIVDETDRVVDMRRFARRQGDDRLAELNEPPSASRDDS